MQPICLSVNKHSQYSFFVVSPWKIHSSPLRYEGYTSSVCAFGFLAVTQNRKIRDRLMFLRRIHRPRYHLHDILYRKTRLILLLFLRNNLPFFFFRFGWNEKLMLFDLNELSTDPTLRIHVFWCRITSSYDFLAFGAFDQTLTHRPS